MTQIKRLASAALFSLFVLTLTAWAQRPQVSTVNVTPDEQNVRIAAVGDVLGMTVSVSDESGEIVFESGPVTGTELDWTMRDPQGQRVPVGVYALTVTYRTSSGKLRRRVEQVLVTEEVMSDPKQESAAPVANAPVDGAGTTGRIAKFTAAGQIGNSVMFENAGRIGVGTMAPLQSIHAVGPSSRLRLQSTNGPALTTTEYVTNGRVWQAGAGGSTAAGGVANKFFVFDQTANQYRLVIDPAGNFGVGTTAPTSKLTVNGGIQILGAGNGIKFADGSIQTKATSGTINGTGTTNRLAKFTGPNSFGNSTITEVSGKVGIGTASPASRLTVTNSIAGGQVVHALNTATTGDASGVRGETAAQSGTGVFGINTHASAFGYGGQFSAKGTGGTAIHAEGGFYGVYSYASQPGSSAIYASGISRGVDGYAEATTGVSYGVFGDADSTDGGHGVHGRADGGTGVNFGVRGEVYSGDGFGGYFQNVTSGNNGTGVMGLASGAQASSLPGGYFAGGGEFVGGNGVIGVADRASGYGVVAIKGAGAYALYAVGNSHIAGTLSKSAGTFKIDHPLDPANKYLSHSFVESPDMMNIYNGNVTTDKEGNAVITMPAYFQALNRDFRYQLTVIGQFAQAIVRSEIKDNRFSIKTDKPNVKVSWQVTGVRQDPYANLNRTPVEQVKPKHEQGTYLFPKGYDQPEEKAVSAEQQKLQQQEKELRGQAERQQPQSQRERRQDIPPVSREREDRPTNRKP